MNDLGGKDIDSMSIAKRLHFDKGQHANAPRAPVRNAMERFEKLDFAKRERKGVKWLFSITERGKQALTVHKDKVAGSTPASNPSTTSTEGIECPWCKTPNPADAEFCKGCGRKQPEAVQAVPVAA